MAELKPLASLSSGLLARKGQAKPAMRRQGLEASPTGPAALDDLGWNDMGGEGEGWSPGEPPASPAREAIESLRERVESSPVSVADPAKLLTPEPKAGAELKVEESGPEVVSLAAEVPTARTVPPIALRRARREARTRTGRTATGKAAFTLRLDAERHLKLRLAAALERASAQSLVTRALDQFLAGVSGLDHLLGELPGDKG